MQNTLVFALLLIVSILTSSAYGSALINVTDSALKVCIQKTMAKADITSVQELKRLKCHNKGVRTLAGLADFTGLEDLSLFGNKIAQADLSKLSQLVSLNLAKNKLHTLVIRGLSHLETLHLFKNELSTIDFEGLLSLKKMRLMQNKLSTLDILPLVSLQEAYLWDNQLEDLQISGLRQLEFLDVKQNPMPDALYDFYDEQTGITISHDGNADDWQ